MSVEIEFAQQAAEALKTSISYLRHWHGVYEEDETSVYYDPDWTVKLEPREVQNLIHNLEKTIAFLNHIGGR